MHMLLTGRSWVKIPLYPFWACNSVGEYLVYTETVGGSNPFKPINISGSGIVAITLGCRPSFHGFESHLPDYPFEKSNGLLPNFAIIGKNLSLYSIVFFNLMSYIFQLFHRLPLSCTAAWGSSYPVSFSPFTDVRLAP